VGRAGLEEHLSEAPRARADVETTPAGDVQAIRAEGLQGGVELAGGPTDPPGGVVGDLDQDALLDRDGRAGDGPAVESDVSPGDELAGLVAGAGEPPLDEGDVQPGDRQPPSSVRVERRMRWTSSPVRMRASMSSTLVPARAAREASTSA
jgi:hypothetical protein